MSHDDEIDKELRFHVDSRIDDLVASGVPLDRARRQARLEFGGVMQTKEAVRDLGVWSIVNGTFSRVTVRPIAAAAPSNCRSQNPWLMTATGPSGPPPR